MPPASSPDERLSRPADESAEGSPLARILALAAVLVAIVVVGLFLFAGGGGYEVSAVFPNAGQLVVGNNVDIGGRPVGSVTDISLTPDGQALVKMSLSEQAPLHQGTSAVIRATSLSGIANRYVAIEPAPSNAPAIRSGGRISSDRTQAPVDLDQLFNTFDPATRAGLQEIIKGSAEQYAGRSAQAGAALHYLNPALSTSSQLTREIVANESAFRAFVADTAKTVHAISQRGSDLTGLVGNADTTMRAIGDENVALGQALGLLPTTLRNADTTFVNLRSTLNDLDQLVAAAKPGTARLAPFLQVLRPLIAEARPTIQDLRALIRTPGPDNDLIDLTRKMPRLADLTSTVFPHVIRSLVKSQPVIEFARPYAPDLTGWLTKFAEGAANYDADGHYARIEPVFNAFSLNSNVLSPRNPSTPGARLQGLQTFKSQRCPGGAMQPPPDHSAPWKPKPTFTCDPSTVPPGP
ncbi:MAG: MCE family protein [Actinobacteria bacterium]|nr:MCE family protein [Actinomycetota bacterium]